MTPDYEKLKTKLIEWRKDPLLFVREVFKAEPDPWQADVLRAFPNNPRIALCANKGPGKSCLLAWIAWNFLLTRPNPKIAATSISGDNLRDGLWSELASWRNRSPLLKAMFIWQKERIFHKDYPETWWMAARTWSKSADPTTVGETLAGLHADYILFELDESGSMPEAIMATAEAALASCKEGHIIQAGNPTDVSGPLYRACKTEDRKNWRIFEITGDPDDPRRSPRVSIQWAREQIDRYGRDNPWVLVNVFGKFPSHGFNALIGADELNAAINRRYRVDEFRHHPKILGIDVARFGDDSSVIFPRQGLQSYDPLEYRNIDGTTGAEYTIRKWNDWKADAVFVDDSGGFGASWIDNLVRLGKSPMGVKFNEKSSDPQYFNKRTEMAFKLVDWLRKGGSIPDIKPLKDALLQTTYTFKNECLILEPKEDVKEKLHGQSPDHMDALMLTFAFPVDKSSNTYDTTKESSHQIDYNPFSRDRLKLTDNQYNYNPRGR